MSGGLKQFLTPILEAGNEGLYAVVRELAGKAGVDMPKLYATKPHPLLDMLPAAAFSSGGEGGIILNRKMIDEVVGSRIDFAKHASIPEELKGVIAHEMGHIKRGDLKLFGIARIAKYTPYACMAGAVAGLYLLRDHWEKNKHNPQSGEALSPKEAEEKLKLPAEVKSPTLEMAKKVALYTVAAGAGLTAGLVGARAMRHHMEYACDKFSKEVMGSGKPLATFLEKFGVYAERLEEKLFNEHNISEKSRSTIRKLARVIESFYHPPIPSRVEHLLR